MTEPPVLPAPPAPEPEPQDKREPTPFWGIADVLLYLGLGIPVFVVAYAIAYAPFLMFGGGGKALRILVPQFVGYACSLIPLWLVFRSRYGRSPLEALRFRVSAPAVNRSVPMGIAVAFAMLAMGVILRTPPVRTPMEDLLRDWISIALVGVLASTIGPVFEEMFFRGLLQPVLSARFGVAVGIVGAALPFAVLHGPQYAWSWRHLLLITFAGSGFGWWRYRTTSTGAATVMHAAYNLTLFAGFVVGRLLETDIPQAV